MAEFLQGPWVWEILWAVVMLAVGFLSANRRKHWHGTIHSRSEFYRYVGGACLTVALMPLGVLASRHIDVEMLWNKLAIATGIVETGAVGILAVWGWQIVRKNQFDINDFEKRISLMIFGLCVGLAAPIMWRLVNAVVIGGDGK